MKDSPELKLFKEAMNFKNELNKNFYITSRNVQGDCLGRNLEKSGIWFRNAVAEAARKEPHLFPYFQSEQNQIEFIKDLIIFVHKTTLTTGNSGGQYLIPAGIANELFLLARSKSFALDSCTIVPMSDNIKYIPKEGTKLSVAWYSEGEELAGGEGTFDRATLQTREVVTLTSKKLSTLITVSNELLEDSAIDIVSMLTEQFLDAMGQELDNQLFNGDGTLVSGVLTAVCGNSVVLNGASFSTITSTNLSEAISKLEQGYLRNARFVVNRMAAHYLRNTKDEALRPIFTTANSGIIGAGDCYGFPVEVSEKISTTDESGSPFGVFGDFSKFLIGQRDNGLVIKFDPYGLYSVNKTRFNFMTRWGFGSGDNNAFCRILNA